MTSPDAELIALRLDLAARQVDEGDGASPHDLLGDDRFQRIIGAHEADGVTWFSREAFENAVTVLGLARPDDLVAAAAASEYRLDDLAKLVAEPPPWTSTRPPRPVPRGGRSPNKRDQSMPPKPAEAGATKKPATTATAAAPAKKVTPAKPKKFPTK